jgi:hypothetical protein
MKKCSVVLVFFILFALLAACGSDPTIIPVTGSNPSAQPLLDTMTAIAITVEGLAGSATAYADTPTPSSTPTPLPNENEIQSLIDNTIKDKLIASLGMKITVVDVKFGPIGAQKYTHLYVEMNCTSDGNNGCPSSQVVSAVVDSCKEKKKKFLENIPFDTQVMLITIYNPGHATEVVEANWSDVVAYVNGDMSADVFGRLIRYTQY